MSSYTKRKRKPMRKAKRRQGGYTTSEVASRALAIAKKANKTELKYLDTSETATLMIPAGVFFNTDVAGVNAGNGINQRIGKAIKPTHLHMRLTSLYNPLATTGSQCYRIIVYQNLLSGLGSGPTAYLESANFLSMKSVNKRYLSRTIYDKSFTVSNDNPQRIHDLRLKIPLSIYYGSSNIPEKNAIKILVISNEVTSANSPWLEGHMRLFYTDK